jgi:hypothetical protein
MGTEQQDPIQVAYERRNRDLDPQFVVQASPLYIQEKIRS